MDPVLIILSSVAILLGLGLLGLKTALAPVTPTKGRTNVPAASGVIWMPILGNAWKLAGISDMHGLNMLFENMIANVISKGGTASSFWMGPRKLLIGIGEPKLNEYILCSSKSSRKDQELYGHLNQMIDGVFSRNGEGWTVLRRGLNRFLQPKTVVEDHFDVIAARSEELCEELDSTLGKGMFDLQPFIQRCALHIVFETLMGIPAAHGRQLERDFDTHWGKRVSSLWFTKILKWHLKIKWLYALSGLKKEVKELQVRIRNFGQKLINCRKRILAESGRNVEDPDFEPECYTDVTIMQSLNEKHDGFMLPIDLIIAGYDTSSVAVSSACLFLAMHPECQKRAYQEQIDIMGNTLRAPTYEEISRMDYLGMVYLETLRHVGVATIARELSGDVAYEDYILPEGASVLVSLHATNVRPDLWEKPKEFHPDHFLPEQVSKRPKGAFLPFSAGARICPGKTFALVSSKIILSMLLRRFHLTTSVKFHEIGYSYQFMLESTQGYPVRLTRTPIYASAA